MTDSTLLDAPLHHLVATSNCTLSRGASVLRPYQGPSCHSEEFAFQATRNLLLVVRRKSRSLVALNYGLTRDDNVLFWQSTMTLKT